MGASGDVILLIFRNGLFSGVEHHICQVLRQKNAADRKQKGKSAYFVPTINISLVLIVVGGVCIYFVECPGGFGSCETEYRFCRDREG